MGLFIVLLCKKLAARLDSCLGENMALGGTRSQGSCCSFMAAKKLLRQNGNLFTIKRLTAAIVSFKHCHGLDNSKWPSLYHLETSWKVNSFYGRQKLFWRERSPRNSCFLKPYTRPLFTFCSLRAYLGWFTCKFLYTFMYRYLWQVFVGLSWLIYLVKKSFLYLNNASPLAAQHTQIIGGAQKNNHSWIVLTVRKESFVMQWFLFPL